MKDKAEEVRKNEFKQIIEEDDGSWFMEEQVDVKLAEMGTDSEICEAITVLLRSSDAALI